MVKRFEFQIEETFHKKRLDEFLFAVFSSLSKMYLRDIVKSAKCEVNGFTANMGILLKTNDFIEIEVDLDRETAMKPQEIGLDVVFEDNHIIVINKPAGLLVHPTHREKNGTLLNGLSFYLNKNQRESGMTDGLQEIPNPKSKIQNRKVRPGMVHRLDKQTSGLIVIAKNQRALRILSNHFKRKLVEKMYLAFVDGIVEVDSGVINAPIGRFAEKKYWDIKEDGKTGITNFWVRERFPDKTLLKLEPVTGRTNQLRIHCCSIGHPIIGDVKYGGRPFSRLCLHAARLKFHHPISNQPLEFEIPPPTEMQVE